MEYDAGQEPLFPTNLPGPEWVEFEAAGYSRPVVGVIYREGEADHGMPLGSVGTGYVNLDTNGTLGRYTLFNRVLPQPLRGMNVPFLGLSAEGQTWVLAQEEIGGLGEANQIHYWGHFPVADLEYETDAPVSVGLRAWTPFLPGDSASSNTPGAVFEVHLRNTSEEVKEGTVAFSFPGPSEVDAMGKAEWDRQMVEGDFTGVTVGSKNRRLQEIPHSSYMLELGYALGIIGDERARIGGALGNDPAVWSSIASELPQAEAGDAGASVAAEFSLEPGEAKTVRFVLAWYAPRWHAQQQDGSPTQRRCYFHTYGSRFAGALEVANHLAHHHDSLLRRVLAWQEVVYTETELPGWLRDSLINSLTLIAQNSFWVRQPTGKSLKDALSKSLTEEHWFGTEGLFSMNESLASCAHPSCICTDWMGNIPLVYFFPDLIRLNLKGFKYYQRGDGEISFDFGISGTNLQGPSYGVGNIDCHPSREGSFYTDLVDRLWLRTGDDGLLREYYPSVKAAIEFIKTRDEDGDGLPEAREFRQGVCGAAIWQSSVWLAALRILERMAEKVGNYAYARDCRAWYALASKSMEEKLWNSEVGSYLFYNDTQTGRRSDTILTFQLSGEWIAAYHGFPGVFPSGRVKAVLDTFKRINIAAAPFGMLCAARPDKTEDEKVTVWGGVYSSCGMLGPMMVMLYAGDARSRELAIEVIRQCWHSMVLEHGLAWNSPVQFNLGKGAWYGEDYYMNTMLWALPAAMLGQDLKTFCAPGGLVDRVVRATR